MAAVSTTITQEPTAAMQSSTEEQVTPLTIAGVTVLKVQSQGSDRILYKLPGTMSIKQLTDEQKRVLHDTIKNLHKNDGQQRQTSNLPATSSIPGTPSTTISSDSPLGTVTPISYVPPPQTSTTQQLKMKQMDEETYRRQHQLLQGLSGNGQSNTSLNDTVKTTRKYNKTGKYSKKKHLYNSGGQSSYNASNQDAEALARSQNMQSKFNINQGIQNNPSYGGSSSSAGTYPNASAMDFTRSSLRPGVKRSAEEMAHYGEVKRRFTNAIIADQERANNPDRVTPFSSMEDVIDRLLPYHIYQYPKGDLKVNQVDEQFESKKTLEIVHKRRKLFERFESISRKDSQRKPSLIASVQTERLLLEGARTDLSILTNDFAKAQTRLAHLINPPPPISAQQHQQQSSMGGAFSSFSVLPNMQTYSLPRT